MYINIYIYIYIYILLAVLENFALTNLCFNLENHLVPTYVSLWNND